MFSFDEGDVVSAMIRVETNRETFKILYSSHFFIFFFRLKFVSKAVFL